MWQWDSHNQRKRHSPGSEIPTARTGSSRSEGWLLLLVVYSSTFYDFGLRSFDTTRVIAKQLQLRYDIHPMDNFTENDMLAIKPRGRNGGDEELGAISVPSKSC
jgi:hypothetical protein